MGRVHNFSYLNVPGISLSSRKTIASFPGGKSGKKHLPLYNVVPQKIDRLIEPFAGLANFFFTISPQVNFAWLNDKDPHVFSLLKSIKEPSYLKELITSINAINPVEKEDYYCWKQKKSTNIIEQAVKLLVILNCSPNGAGGGYSYQKAHRKWYQNKPKVWYQLSEKLQKVRITNWDYKEVLNEILENQFENDFIYLDPPYFKVAERGNLYPKFNSIYWDELKNLIKPIRCHWLMSNRDCLETREMFKNYFLFSYNTYNDMNNTKNGNPELLVSNKPLYRKH
ncbi:MAG: DNA adenine methylase [Candidatus Hodarchaeota archaeon]